MTSTRGVVDLRVKGVIVAGGQGSRMMPFTRYTHKTLLPIFDRPVIDYALDTMRMANIRDITIIANEHIGQITQHIGSGMPGERINFVIEERPEGVYKAINLARPYLEGSRAMVYFSDNITTWDFSGDVEKFEESVEPPGAVLLAREVDDPSSFGVCEIGSDGNVVDIVEKPESPPSNLAIGGIYLFDERFWGIMDEEAETRGDEFSISDVTRRYVRMNAASIRNMGVETWIDCGTPTDLLRAGEMASSGKLRLGADKEIQ
jgi:glucose-1-phosphate thymidylyltransferase